MPDTDTPPASYAAIRTAIRKDKRPETLIYYGGWIKGEGRTVAKHFSSLRTEAARDSVYKQMSNAFTRGQDAFVSAAHRIADEFQIPVKEVFTFMFSR